MCPDRTGAATRAAVCLITTRSRGRPAARLPGRRDGQPGGMTGPTSEKGSPQQGEPAPEAASPFTDADDTEQADREGRHVERDVQDNADLDG